MVRREIMIWNPLKEIRQLSLHLVAYENYDFRPDENFLYKLQLKLTGQNEDTYKLTVNMHAKKQSKSKPKENYDTWKNDFLSFDKKNKVFFNSLRHLEGHLVFNDLKIRKQGRYLKEDVPQVILGKYSYIYVYSRWYSEYKGEFYSMFY